MKCIAMFHFMEPPKEDKMDTILDELKAIRDETKAIRVDMKKGRKSERNFQNFSIGAIIVTFGLAFYSLSLSLVQSDPGVSKNYQVLAVIYILGGGAYTVVARIWLEIKNKD